MNKRYALRLLLVLAATWLLWYPIDLVWIGWEAGGMQGLFLMLLPVFGAFAVGTLAGGAIHWWYFGKHKEIPDEPSG